MVWIESWRASPAARAIADRHYNRQKVGAPQFVPPGRCLVLITEAADAFWVTSWPFAEYVKHAWPGAWMCSAFRNEGPTLSSTLVTEAVAATRAYFGEPPAIGFVTFVDPAKTRRKRDPGRCFRRAGLPPCHAAIHGGWARRAPATPGRHARSCATPASATEDVRMTEKREPLDDRLVRLQLMAGGDPKYDLSPNDRATIGVALDSLTRLDEARKHVDRVEEEYRLFRTDVRRQLEEVQTATYADTGETWEAECMRARAERDRLRAALVGVLDVCRDRQAFVMMGPRAFVKAERIAQDALKEGGDHE